MNYRKPKDYIPPYNYCDRWCERCAIDKSKCLIYQTEADDRLHREIDGKGEPTLEETVEQVRKNLSSAVEMVREKAKELGIDLDKEARTGRLAPNPPRRERLVEEARALTMSIAPFLREYGRDFPEEAETLRWYFTLPAPKLHRALNRARDEFEEADHILQAQVAHKALVQMAASFESIRRKRPSLADELLDMLVSIQKLQRAIEEKWLARPCSLLVPAPGEKWWGPLRDISAELRDLRRSL